MLIITCHPTKTIFQIDNLSLPLAPLTTPSTKKALILPYFTSVRSISKNAYLQESQSESATAPGYQMERDTNPLNRSSASTRRPTQPVPAPQSRPTVSPSRPQSPLPSYVPLFSSLPLVMQFYLFPANPRSRSWCLADVV